MFLFCVGTDLLVFILLLGLSLTELSVVTSSSVKFILSIKSHRLAGFSRGRNAEQWFEVVTGTDGIIWDFFDLFAAIIEQDCSIILVLFVEFPKSTIPSNASL